MKQTSIQSQMSSLSGTSQQNALLQQLKSHLQQLLKSHSQQKQTKTQLTRKLKQLLQKKEYYSNQKVIQQKKYKSFNLLVNQLQSSYQKLLVEMRSKQLQLTEDQDKKVILQNHLLRQQLIKLNEIIKEDQKLFSFLKQLEINKTNITNFIKKSDIIESQTETIAKLQTYINQLANPNLECRRKWNMLKKQMQKSQRHMKIHKLQVNRQNQLLKSSYEEYLQKINSAKTKIVHFNETKREKLITDYLVQQMALIQQKRLQVEQQNKNLHFHMQQLQHQHEKVSLQNSELQSFFTNDNRQEQSRLAMKMKHRIDELKDSLVEIQTRNQIVSVLNKRNNNLEFVRSKLIKSKQANDFLLMKQQKINNGDFSQLNQKQISQFFTNIIKQTELKTQTTKQRTLQINNQLKQLKMKEILLESQVSNLQEILKQNSVEKSYQRRQILGK